ncbi:MAG: hypothetical protein QM564_04430 [Bergeyella sp.]
MSENTVSKMFSWKIKESTHSHEEKKCCNEEIDLLKDTEIIFKTDEKGRYQEIQNIYAVKQKIRENLTEEKIKKAVKESKNREHTAIHYKWIKQDPSNIIRSAEFDIRRYFNYYGVFFDEGTISSKNIRSDFPHDKYELPFDIKISLSQTENIYNLSIANTLDKLAMTEESWNNVHQPTSEMDGFKKKYNMEVLENYMYLADDGYFSKVDIKSDEYAFQHPNGIHNYTFSVKVEKNEK